MPRIRLPPWSWHGIVAVILASSLGLAFILVGTIVALRSDANETAVAGLLHLGTLLAGALAGWLGGSAVTAANAQRSADEHGTHPVEADTGPYIEPDDPTYTGTPDQDQHREDS